ncbi:MAG TPA: FAD-dependent monooxygenase [Rhodopila sp.]|nr:FAD-dependent monooxygenase [Rhodopila sp.]
MRPGETFDSVDRERCIRLILGVGSSFPFEVIIKEDWTARRMIANKFRDRRVFLCGDASHIWVPNAGYGMNPGIADAMNLSRMLAAVLNGWAEPAILDAYEAEWQPITEQVSRYAMNTSMALAKQRSAIPDNVEDPGPEGAESRRRIGQEAYEINLGQFCCGGLNFGYFYDSSPLIAYDGEKHPAYTIYDFQQSTVPGCRTPHIWLPDGASLYDRVGREFTLLRFDRGVEIDGLITAAARRRLSKTVLDCEPDKSAYAEKLVLSRPDQHVAWRGNAQPANPLVLIDRLRGALI